MRSCIRCALMSLLLVFVLAGSSLAKKQQANNIDFGAITCEEFVADVSSSDDESVGIVFMWLDGYLSGVSGDTRLNWNNLEIFSTKLMKGCASRPKSKVLEVAKSVGIN